MYFEVVLAFSDFFGCGRYHHGIDPVRHPVYAGTEKPGICQLPFVGDEKEKNLPVQETMDYTAFKDSQIEKLAAVVEEALDMKKLDEILGLL